MKNKNFWRKRPANKQPFLFNWAIAIHNTPIKAKLSYTPPAVIEQRAQGAKILLLCGSSQFAALWLAAQATTTHSALGPMQWAFVFTGNSSVPTEVAVLTAFSRSSVPPPPPLPFSLFLLVVVRSPGQCCGPFAPPPPSLPALSLPVSSTARVGPVRSEESPGRLIFTAKKGEGYPPGYGVEVTWPRLPAAEQQPWSCPFRWPT